MNQNVKSRMTIALWVVQALLAIVFLVAGVAKFVIPIEEMVAQMPAPPPMPLPTLSLFLRFIGTCEVLGAIGLILPGLLRIRAGLTPLAAVGLVIIMIGATAITVAQGQGLMALSPAIVGLLAAFVAYGRWQLAPFRGLEGQRTKY
jgi:uncharacterized membrane protein YphA (DoxX/SURF4 family)